MKIRVQREDGLIETVTLLDGPCRAITDGGLTRITNSGFSHYFNPDGYYNGWGGLIPRGSSWESVRELVKAGELKRQVEKL